MIISFNPCFPGSSAESGFLVYASGSRLHVSILVFLDQALKEKTFSGVICCTLMFQSLFSWIKR